MDDLLQEFLTETGENLDTVDRELVRFEQEPNNRDILGNIFRLVHTVKGTCGFIGLPRLEALTHAAESLIGQFRDGANVSAIAVTAVLETIDRVKDILSELAEKGEEPAGSDENLIRELGILADHARSQLLQSRPAPAGVTDPVAAYLARHAPPEIEPRSEDGLDLVFRAAPGPQRGRDGRIETAPSSTANEDAGPRDSRPVGPTTLRVNVDTIEHLMTMVSELVLTRNQLLEISRKQEDNGLKGPLQRLSLITAELQDGVMKTRMQPIGNAWSKLPRIVRDLGAELGKRIELITEGADTELDRQILDLIKDPLIHMVRNCADHAIEQPDERRALGKPEIGTIRLAAYHEGGSVTIAIADDGRGLDIERIRRKAARQGLASEAEIERMTDAQVSRFIFHPGFSTADSITAISGRGVGMDVVKVNVDAIGGLIDIASKPGVGTTIKIKIPLTLAIVAALIVVAGDQRFAIPQIVVRELVRVKPGADHRIENINGAPILRLRGRLLPVIALSALMGTAEPAFDDGFIVVTQIGERQFGILVDGVFHTEEIVVKPMSSKLRHIPLFSGNTILGDGAVVLIVDPNGVAGLVGGTGASEAFHVEAASNAAPVADKTTMLVFRTGEAGLRAVPLSLVTRLEEVDASLFEHGSGRTLLHYRNRLIPVVPVAETRLRQDGLQPLVIISEGEMTVALAVDAIVDIVDEVLDIEMVAVQDRGIVGSTMIRGRATDIIDLAHYLPIHERGWSQHGPGANIGDPSAGAQVLLVEPSRFLRDMLTPVLKASGHRTVFAADFETASQQIAAERVATILIDLDGDIDGAFAFVARLRESPGGDRFRLIGMTTLVTPDLHMRAGQARLDEVVAKFDRRALLGELADRRFTVREAA
jgi:two-component system chemotaxis sensor kinase CheA